MFFNSTLQKKLQGSEKGEDQPDWPPAAHHGANEGGGERGHRPAQDTKNTGTDMSSQRTAEDTAGPFYYVTPPGENTRFPPGFPSWSFSRHLCLY